MGHESRPYHHGPGSRELRIANRVADLLRKVNAKPKRSDSRKKGQPSHGNWYRLLQQSSRASPKKRLTFFSMDESNNRRNSSDREAENHPRELREQFVPGTSSRSSTQQQSLQPQSPEQIEGSHPVGSDRDPNGRHRVDKSKREKLWPFARGSHRDDTAPNQSRQSENKKAKQVQRVPVAVRHDGRQDDSKSKHSNLTQRPLMMEREKLFSCLAYARQSADDQSIYGRVEKLYSLIDQHVSNFYIFDKLRITPEVQEELKLIKDPRLQPNFEDLECCVAQDLIIRRTLTAMIVRRSMAFDDGLGLSLLPTDFTDLFESSMRRQSPIPIAYEQEFTALWRLVTCHLRPDVENDEEYLAERDERIKKTVARFSNAFRSWEDPSAPRDDRDRNLSGILKQAASLGIALFSQTSLFYFDFSLPETYHGKNDLLVFPRFLKVLDENAQELDGREPLVNAKIEKNVFVWLPPPPAQGAGDNKQRQRRASESLPQPVLTGDLAASSGTGPPHLPQIPIQRSLTSESFYDAPISHTPRSGEAFIHESYSTNPCPLHAELDSSVRYELPQRTPSILRIGRPQRNGPAELSTPQMEREPQRPPNDHIKKKPVPNGPPVPPKGPDEQVRASQPIPRQTGTPRDILDVATRTSRERNKLTKLLHS